ncbi:hypothetical protein [Pedobacter nototheniae]|uniref:hypothetical protein n=1 Tax=Pedobacter nototheniae TaxID=2488994 RepID=UPI00292CF72B|nr:hypothetical protein [Pedobacter nototheniae]
MKKILTFCLLSLLISKLTFSQTSSVKDKYWDYTQIRMVPGEQKEAIAKALDLLNYKTELNEKQIANLSFHLGRLYEETGEPEKSIPYYKECIKIVPGYYVPYRALAAMRVDKSNILTGKLNEAGKQKNTVLYNQYFAEYKKEALITLAYLEKAQACDPDEKTLEMITFFYKSIKDNQSISTLDARLKSLASNCVTLLDDE